MIRGMLHLGKHGISLWWICIILLLAVGSQNAPAQSNSDNRPSFAISAGTGQSQQQSRQLVIARDELRKAFIQKDYTKVLSISEAIRQEYPSYSADSFYETAAQMRLTEKALAASGSRPYPKLEDLPSEARDLSTAPSLGLTADLERQLERIAQQSSRTSNGQPVSIEVAANTQFSDEPGTAANIDESVVPAITPIPALTPNIDLTQPTSPVQAPAGDQGPVPPGINTGSTQSGTAPPDQDSVGTPGEQMIATASTPVPVDSAVGAATAAPAGGLGSGPIEIFGITLPLQLGYILIGIIVAVIIVVVLLQFIGRRREDRDLEVALATHGGTLSGTQGNALLDDEDEDMVQGYPPELDEHSGSTQIDAFDDESGPIRREAIQSSSSSAVEEVPAADEESMDSVFTDDAFDALFSSNDEADPDEDTGMETGIIDSFEEESKDLPATDFGSIEIPEMNFQDNAVSESDETFSFDFGSEPEHDQEGSEPKLVLDDEVHMGSPSIWSELDAAGVGEDSDVISFDEPDGGDSGSDNSDVDMGSATHTSFEERAMESTNGMSESEIQKQLDEDLPSTEMTMREFHQDETVDVKIAEASENESTDGFVFDEPELSPTKDADVDGLDLGGETQVSNPELDNQANEPEHAATSDATSFANMEQGSSDVEDSDLSLDSPEVADTQGITDIHGMETQVVDPPDFGPSSMQQAPQEPKQSALQNLIQSSAKPQEPADKGPIVNVGDSLFDRELRQGEDAYDSGDWGRAVHHLSIAAALKPDNKPIREKLREARSKRNQD